MSRMKIVLAAALIAFIVIFPKQAGCTVQDDLTSEVKTESPESTTEVIPETQFGSAVTAVDFELPNFNNTDEDVEEPYNKTNTQRIAASTVAARGDYPYVVYLSSTVPSGTRVCSGALLTTEYIITAASCVYDATSILVNMGIIATAVGAFTATAIVPHHYRAGLPHHDIALVRLTTPAILGANIGLIKIAPVHAAKDNAHLAGKTVQALGFGPTTATGTAALTFARMKVYTSGYCSRLMRTRNLPPPSHPQSCLDTDGGVLGLCTQADVGGPVIYRFDTDTMYTLVGVLNYYQACLSWSPNVFTRISPYMGFIRMYIPAYAG